MAVIGGGFGEFAVSFTGCWWQPLCHRRMVRGTNHTRRRQGGGGGGEEGGGAGGGGGDYAGTAKLHAAHEIVFQTLCTHVLGFASPTIERFS